MRVPLSRVLLPALVQCAIAPAAAGVPISSGRSAHPMVVTNVLDPRRSGKGEILQRHLKFGKIPMACAGKAESGKEASQEW